MAHIQRRALCVAFFCVRIPLPVLCVNILSKPLCVETRARVRACTTNVHKAHTKRGKKYIIPRSACVCVYARAYYLLSGASTMPECTHRSTFCMRVVCLCGSFQIINTNIGDMLGASIGGSVGVCVYSEGS